jgi:hypothetical protein
MRTSITIGIDAKGNSRLVCGPEVPADEQRKAFFKLGEGKPPKDFERVELWSSDGHRKVYHAETHRARIAHAKAAEKAEKAADDTSEK